MTCALFVDRGRHRRAAGLARRTPGCPPRRGQVVVDDHEPVLGDRPPPTPTPTRPCSVRRSSSGSRPCETTSSSGPDAPGRSAAGRRPRRRGARPPARRSVEHLVDRRPNADRALDRGAPLEQPSGAIAKRLERPNHRQRHPEDARHAAQDDHLFGAKRVGFRRGPGAICRAAGRPSADDERRRGAAPTRELDIAGRPPLPRPHQLTLRDLPGGEADRGTTDAAADERADLGVERLGRAFDGRARRRRPRRAAPAIAARNSVSCSVDQLPAAGTSAHRQDDERLVVEAADRRACARSRRRCRSRRPARRRHARRSASTSRRMPSSPSTPRRAMQSKASMPSGRRPPSGASASAHAASVAARTDSLVALHEPGEPALRHLGDAAERALVEVGLGDEADLLLAAAAARCRAGG